MPGERNSSILLIHDDPDLLHSLTEVLERAGFDVAIAATAFAATNQLEERSQADEFGAVVAGWGAGGRSGLRVYCWVLEHRHHMRARFVFLADEEPLGFKTLVKERCPLLKPSDVPAILSAVRSIMGLPSISTEIPVVEDEDELDEVNDFDELPASALKPSTPTSRSKPPPAPPSVAALAEPTPQRNELVTLLLVEDEILLLNYMRKRFSSAGFAVSTADSGSEAIQLLGGQDYDVVLADWYMPNGSGEELYNWIQLRRPELVTRCFFMSGAVGAEVHSEIAPTGCKVFPKGQDPELMIQALLSAGRDVKKSGHRRA